MTWCMPCCMMSGPGERVNDALRAELLERAGRDQTARQSLPHGHDMQQWEEMIRYWPGPIS